MRNAVKRRSTCPSGTASNVGPRGSVGVRKPHRATVPAMSDAAFDAHIRRLIRLVTAAAGMQSTAEAEKGCVQ